MGKTNDMGNTNACMAYIDRLAYVGTTYCPGRLIISASTGGYANTNYCVDGVGTFGTYLGRSVTNSLSLNGISPSAIIYADGSLEDVLGNHITRATNVAGYFSLGHHSALSYLFAIDGTVKFQGQSGWFIMTTFESYNGLRDPGSPNGLSTYAEWCSSGAFGGAGYENTPVAAVANTDECICAPDPVALLGLWAAGKTSAICCWQAGWSQQWITTLVAGDPFVKR